MIQLGGRELYIKTVGQSQANGHEPIANLQSQYSAIDTRCKVFNSIGKGWETLSPGNNTVQPKSGTNSPYTGTFGWQVGLVSKLVAYYNARVWYESYAQDGTNSGNWIPNNSIQGSFTSGDIANNNMDIALGIAEATANILIGAYIYNQSEANSSVLSVANAFQATLTGIINAQLGNLKMPTLPVILVAPSDTVQWTYRSITNQAMINIAATLSNVYFIPTDGLGLNDNGVHFDAAANEIIATRIFNVLIGIYQ